MQTRSVAAILFTLFVLVGSRSAYSQVSVNTTTLSFGNVAVNNTSAPKNVTVTNKTAAAISIMSISTGTGSPFAVKSTTCGSSLAASKSCTISVTFTPTALGTVSGTLSVTDSGTPSSLAITLTGTGVYPVALSPSSPSFGNITVGNSSSANTITLKNVQNVPLTISSITASANFKQTNNCPLSPNTLAAGGTCSISVVFTPAAFGTTSGTLAIVHSAYGSPTIANLRGNGVLPVVLSPIALNFGFQKIGTTSSSKTIKVTNEQPVALSVTLIQTTGDFKQTNNCPLPPATLAAGTSCSVNVTFAPMSAGIRTGQLSVSDSAVTSPPTAALSGTGGAVLQSISVTPSTASVAVGHTQQFSATGFYNDGSQKDLTASATWKSSNSKVATVSAGLATGVGTGNAIISATQSGISGSATLTVTNLTLTSISITPANPSIALGTQQQFHATGTYSNGSTLDITNSVAWASSSTATATISAAGLATSKAIGQSTVSATSGTLSVSTVLTVTPAHLLGISVTPPSASIPMGTTQQFAATGTFTDGTVQNLTASANWSSSQTTVATVISGLALPVSTGATTITASVGSISGSATVTVTAAALVSLAVTPSTPSVALGNTQQFAATGTFTDGSTRNLTTQVSWGSANTSIASLNSVGLAMTVATGTTQITATSGSITNSATLTVTAASLVSIAVTPAIPMVPLGETQQFTATGMFTDGSIQDITQSASWSSSNGAVATISVNPTTIGLVSTLLQGTTIIAATQSGVSGSTTLTVNPAVLVSITLSPSPLTLPNGTTQQLVATGKYSDGTTQTLTAGVITWTSSNAAIATVSASGVVTAVAATGSATVTAQDGNVTSSVVVQDSSAVLVSIAVSPSTPSIPLGTPQQFTAFGTYSDNSTQNLTSSVQWMSSNPSVATISVSSGTAGLAQSPPTGTTGSTIITAVSGSVSETATLTVTPAALVSISLTPLAPSIGLGRSQQFTATGTYTDGTSNDLTTTVAWSASPATVAVISNQVGSQGLAASAGVGSSTITATLGAVSFSTTLTVGPATIVSIAVTPATSTISVGLTQQFTATATYTDGTTNDVTSTVTWSSSAATIAAMANNAATGMAPGSVTVTAASGSAQGTANLTVFALPLISSFVLTATTITSGSAITLTANFANGTGLINPGAIAVASGGSVNLAPTATTTYTLTVTNGAGTSLTAQTTVTVVPAPVITSFNAGAATITAGGSTTLTPVFSNGTGVITPGPISVTSGVAVSVNPAATTTYTLTVTNPTGTSVTSTAVLTVVTPPVITSFNAGAATITAGGSTTLTPVFSNGTGVISPGPISVTSGVAVSVNPAATTTYTLTVTNAAGTSTTAIATITVSTATLVSITVMPANSSISLGGTQMLTATGHYSDSTTQDLTATATWTSSATGVATMSGSTATAPTTGCGGSTTISATVGVVTGSTVLTVVVIGGSTCGGNLTVARDPHTSTLLRDGTVLVAGGISSAGVAVSSAEIYTPSTNVSAALAVPMTTARASHTATLLNNGKVLIVGGLDGNGNPLASAEIFDPTASNSSGGAGTFTVTGSLSTARFRHTATLLIDGTVLIAGGYSSNSQSAATALAEIYNPSSGTFSQFSGSTKTSGNSIKSYGGMTIPRGDHTATLLADGTGDVLIAGGIDNTGNPSQTFELYDPPCRCFYNSVDANGNALNMNDYRAEHTATLLNDGTVLIAGGEDAIFAGGVVAASYVTDIYTPSTYTMTLGSQPNTQRYSHTATLLTNGQVLLAGGRTYNSSLFSNPVTASMELYDPVAQTWTATGGLQTARYEQTATRLESGTIFISGGADSAGNPLASFELYTPTSVLPTRLSGSISVAPSSLQIPVGITQTFTATAVVNGVTESLTNVTWTSSNTGALTLTTDAVGNAIATPVSSASLPQQVIVQACFGSDTTHCGQATVTVTSAVAASLAITPASQFIPIPPGGAVPFTATATYTDGSVHDDSALVTWSSSSTAVAIMSANVATPVGIVGTSTITASEVTDNSVTVSASATLTVSNVIATGQLNIPRLSDTATVLTDGTVLFVGGQSVAANTSLSQAELYNSATGTFTASLNLTTLSPMGAQTATLLNNGQVLLVGAGTPELFDPISQTFSNTGSIKFPRSVHTATVIKCSCANNGKVLIAGGVDSNGIFDNSAELYDPAAGTFRLTGSMTTGRNNHTATMLNNGKILIAGGYSSASQSAGFWLTTDSAELFDPSTETFSPTGSLADLPYYFGGNLSSLIGKGRAQHTTTLLNDGIVLMAGGFVNAIGGVPTIAASYPPIYEELYDPVAGTFSATAALLNPRVWDTATLLNDGTVLFAGGGFSASGLASLAPNELYDPINKKFTLTGNLQFPRYNNTATLLTNGNVLIAGGLINANGTAPSSAELYRPTTFTPSNVTAITVTPTNSTIAVGTSQNMIATGNNGQQLASVTWSSSDPAIITVTNDFTNAGAAYAISAGTVTITACAGTVCGSTLLTAQ